MNLFDPCHATSQIGLQTADPLKNLHRSESLRSRLKLTLDVWSPAKGRSRVADQVQNGFLSPGGKRAAETLLNATYCMNKIE